MNLHKGMNKSTDLLKKEDYLFVLERVTKRIPYAILIFLLCYIPVIIWIVTKLYIIQTNEASFLWPYFVNEIIWNYPGAISIALIAYLSKYIRNRAVDNFNLVLKYVKNPKMVRNLMKKTFSSNDHVKYPLVFGFIAMLFQIIYLIFIPWPWWQIWYERSYALTLISAIDITFLAGIYYYLIFMFGYFCLAELYIIHRIGNSLDQITIRELEMKSLSPLGSQAFVICASWSVGVGILLLILSIAPITWWTALQMVAFFTSVLCFFFFSQYSIHKRMSDICRRTSDKTRSRFWDVYENIESLYRKDDIKFEKISILNLTLANLERITQRIDNLSKWPFEKTDIYKIIAIFLVSSVVSNRGTIL